MGQQLSGRAQHKMIAPRSVLSSLVFSLLVSLAAAGNIAEELILAGATTLADLVVKAGLDETLATSGPFTVFAPDNDAFSKVPESILEALGSDTELLKKVMKVDLKADNGMIHVVADVLFPIPENDLVDTLIADERFSTLVTAATAAGIVDILRTKDLTIFAPTNDAFAKIPSEALNGLLADKEALTAVLLRHALPGALFSRGITWQEHKTAGGDMVATQVFKMGIVKVVSYNDDKRTGARVEEADIIASNGVIHAIDTVI